MLLARQRHVVYRLRRPEAEKRCQGRWHRRSGRQAGQHSAAMPVHTMFQLHPNQLQMGVPGTRRCCRRFIAGVLSFSRYASLGVTDDAHARCRLSFFVNLWRSARAVLRATKI